MAVVQVNFDIPADIMTGLLTGEYRLVGGVVRVAIGPKKGQIVKHLDPVASATAEQARGIGLKIIQLAKQNKTAVIIGGTLLIAGAVGGIVYKKVKEHENAVLSEFRTALRLYVEDIRNSSLSVESIDNLMCALNNLKCHNNFEQFKLELSAEDIDTLVSKIYYYTLLLAMENNIELSDSERLKTDSAIINLESYLKTQKRIFDEAA